MQRRNPVRRALTAAAVAALLVLSTAYASQRSRIWDSSRAVVTEYTVVPLPDGGARMLMCIAAPEADGGGEVFHACDQGDLSGAARSTALTLGTTIMARALDANGFQ